MRWMGRVLIVVLGLIVIGTGGTYVWLLSSLPQLDGQLAVPKLEAPVDIVRDRHGIPHICAESERDAYFALGSVHAQDRLWQMELNRRIGAGRLAEIMGERAVDFDRYLRTLSVYEYSERNFARLDADTRAIFEAYAAGVNGFFATRRPAPPPEFVFLRHRPEPWRPADSLAWGKRMAWSLGTNWSNKLLRASLAERLSASQIADFFPHDGGVAVFPPRELAGLNWRPMLDGLAHMDPAWPHPANGSTTGLCRGVIR
jgi:penicillin amidase